MCLTLPEKLAALRIPGTLVNITENSFNTCYYVEFSPDVTLNRINARQSDLELFFGSSVNIETEKGLIIFKVSKGSRDAVTFNDFLYDIPKNYEIPLIMGMTEDGTRLYYDLVNMPHLLVAGSTGSGKSVFMHDMILSMLYNSNTELLLVDVKRVEFSLHNELSRLLCPVIDNPRDAKNWLYNLCFEMDKRYKMLQSSGCRNISEYRKSGGSMHYIACFIDELADLVLYDPDIEKHLIRLAQLGRAAGIHLILATQRPDSTILSGLIRANIPSRVCFTVQKATDSRIVLDMSGAEKLRGQGDGLFLPIGSKNPIRFQAPYISTEDIKTKINKAINNKK